jgi:hypothetical protein
MTPVLRTISLLAAHSLGLTAAEIDVPTS